MSGKTKIEWCDKVWNPVTGCDPVSAGCEHCYAKRMATRLAGRCGYSEIDPFIVTMHEGKVEEPLLWKKPARIFVNSMGDLFHKDVNSFYLEEIFKTIKLATWHTFIILTKRPDRMYQILSGHTFMPNVWLGVTAENQEMADERIPVLLQTPAAVRFVSVEPMLGAVDLTSIKWARIPVYPKNYARLGVPAPKELWSLNNALFSRPGDEWNEPKIALDWVICGGETGPGARPMDPSWVGSLQDQCSVAGVPFFFKGWGEFIECEQSLKNNVDIGDKDPVIQFDHPGRNYWRVGKKKSGRLIYGREWNEFPNPPTPFTKGA